MAELNKPISPWFQNPYMGFKVVEFERLNFEKKQKYLQNHNEICQHCGGDQMSNFIFLILLFIF